MKKLKNIAYNIIQIIKIVNILFLARKEWKTFMKKMLVSF